VTDAPYSCATVPELRHQLVVAQTLAKAHIAFVVVPAVDAATHLDLMIRQLEGLRDIERLAEKAQEVGS
jgi:hypothetical protein